MNSRKEDPKFIRSYERGMLRSAFVSLFWGIITELKKSRNFTLQALAKTLGTNKAEVSRWFNGDPNWTINTIANIANALNVDLNIYAIDRVTGTVYTPSGIVTPAQVQICGVKSVTSAPSTDPLPTRTLAFPFNWNVEGANAVVDQAA